MMEYHHLTPASLAPQQQPQWGYGWPPPPPAGAPHPPAEMRPEMRGEMRTEMRGEMRTEMRGEMRTERKRVHSESEDDAFSEESSKDAT